jgi:hypothetical protein
MELPRETLWRGLTMAAGMIRIRFHVKKPASSEALRAVAAAMGGS